MAQVINDPYSGNIFGRIGKGIGQGLSEQLPKEIERSRLSSGLKKLGEQDFSGQNLLSTLGDIYNIPGITPEIAALAQQQIQKQNFLNRGEGKGVTSSGKSVKQLSNAMRPKNISNKVDESGFASPEEIASYKSAILQEPGFDEINDLSKEILQEGITQDPNEATRIAEQQLTQNRLAQQNRLSNFRNQLNTRVSLDLQNSGLGSYGDISGKIQNSLLDQGEYMVSELGFTPEEATQRISDIAYELGLTTNNLNELGSFGNMFTSSSSKSTALRDQRAEFEKYGYGEIFDDMAAAAMGITPLQVAHILDPIKNKNIEDQLKKLKKSKQKSTENNIDETSLDNLINSITPEDNLFSIEYALRDKHLDIQQFKQRIQQLQKGGKIKLTPQQKRQQKRKVSTSFLGDLLYQAL